MSTSRSPDVDAYVARAPAWARPILEKIRALVHRGCAEMEEKIKWGVPSFERKGIVAGMAAFKEHVAFGFWKASLLEDPSGRLGRAKKASPFAEKVRSLADLPPDRVVVDHVRRAVALNEAGVKVPRPKRKPRPEAAVPPELAAALAKNRKARAAFEGFPPSHRREYCEWIAEAKRPETKAKRAAEAVRWMSEGRSRNWKYERPAQTQRRTRAR
jgi:uncharacterized protein YdeI (YjbR/CyaY-like superfamily)